MMYALAHGEDVWPQGRYEALRSRVTNFVSKTYSRVILVIDLWDQTGPDWSPPWNGGVTRCGPPATRRLCTVFSSPTHTHFSCPCPSLWQIPPFLSLLSRLSRIQCTSVVRQRSVTSSRLPRPVPLLCHTIEVQPPSMSLPIL